MKYFFLLIIVLVHMSFVQKPKKAIELDSHGISGSDSIRSADSLLTRLSTYPFSKATRIELFSYPDRMQWDLSKKHGTSSDVNILRNGKLDIKQKKIKDRKELSPSEQTELFDILYNTPCDDKKAMRCYAPRHALIFYDSNRKAFAFIEICLACRTARTSAGVQVDISCPNRIDALISLFKHVGIKYGLNGKDE